MSRMSEERMHKALEQLKNISPEDHAKVKNLASIVRPLRSVLHKTPDDYGLPGWQNIYFQSDDGTPLEGWYIPAKGAQSDKLVIFNHALPMCRAGFPGHLGEPWSMYDAVEIDFVLQQKHLSDAGYNVLAYDIRNHGTSSAANGGISGIGRWEWRDCVGVKTNGRAIPKTPKRLSICLEARRRSCFGSETPRSASETATTTSAGTRKRSSRSSINT